MIGFGLINNPNISIHAAREGGDIFAGDWIERTGISIHAAREGGDHGFGLAVTPRKRFQSTPPVKAATFANPSISFSDGFQSTPPVKAATWEVYQDDLS